jgi:hypothetical protein
MIWRERNCAVAPWADLIASSKVEIGTPVNIGLLGD